MNENSNKWTWKDSELISALTDANIEIPQPFVRKEAINLLNKKEEEMAEGYKDLKSEVKKLEEEDPNMHMLTVIFHSIGEKDLPYVPVGVNGNFFYIPKEREVKVPKFLLGVLNDASEERIYPQTLENGKIQWKSRKVQRYPYSVINF